MSIHVGNADFKVLPSNPQAKVTGVHESLLQDSEKDIIWYRENFFGKGATQHFLVNSRDFSRF